MDGNIKRPVMIGNPYRLYIRKRNFDDPPAMQNQHTVCDFNRRSRFAHGSKEYGSIHTATARQAGIKTGDMPSIQNSANKTAASSRSMAAAKKIHA